MLKIVFNNFASKRYTSLAVTPSIPLRAATREVVDAIHTKTTVLAGVIYTVINVCRGIKTTKYFLTKLNNK